MQFKVILKIQLELAILRSNLWNELMLVRQMQSRSAKNYKNEYVTMSCNRGSYARAWPYKSYSKNVLFFFLNLLLNSQA